MTEAKRRQKIWVHSIKSKSVFEPSRVARICSDHFSLEDFERRFSSLPIEKNANFPRLKEINLKFVSFRPLALWDQNC